MLSHLLRLAHSVLREHGKRTDRSPNRRTVEREHLAVNPLCAACGGKRRVQVHHIRPFHLHPELELDPKNLITLCMGPTECHLRIGHGDDFKAYNPNVIADAAEAFAHRDRIDAIDERAKANRKETA
jgi:hypothetical protein